MDLRHLRVFTVVARVLNFRKAAEELHLAQPAVSATIADLERALGTQLLDRSRHHVALTAVGREVLTDAQRLLLDAERLQDRARRLHRGEVGRLRIGFLASATAHLLPGAIRSWRTKHPQVQVLAEELSPEQQLADLLADRIDLALSRPMPAKLMLTQQKIYDDRLMLAISTHHPKAVSSKIDLASCAGETFIQYHRAGAADLFDAAVALCREAGFTPLIGQEVRNMATALTLVAAGQGISLVPGCVANLAVAEVKLLTVSPRSPVIPLVAAWSEARPNPLIASFMSTLRAQLR